MKTTLKYIYIAAVAALAISGCQKDNDYISGTISPFISNFDLKMAHKESDLVLNSVVMKGATSIKGVVISDFSSGNTPSGLLIIQNSRIVGNGIDSVRGMAVNIGADAAKYTIGDSVHIKVEGGVLKRVNGTLQITGLAGSAINKVASGKTIKVPVVNIGKLLASPGIYENTLITISNTVVEPEPVEGETFAGEKTINDGFGKAILHTESAASFAANQLPPSANFTGVVHYEFQNNLPKPHLWMRTADDAFELPLIRPTPIIITGFLNNPDGADASATAQNEYIQFMATKDIDFSATPFAVVTTNNAGSNLTPVNGWAIGAARTYKFNLTSGTVKKGEFFYVGGATKFVWGASSISMADANWITAVNYASNPGADFGTPTTNLLANSGNIAGIAVFEGITVTASSVPMDVIMFGGSNANSGNVYGAGPPEVGYRITNTDYYSTINPTTRSPQRFYGAGSNVNRLGFPTGGSFARLGGIYDATSGRWRTGRSLSNVPMSRNTLVSELETGTNITLLEN